MITFILLSEHDQYIYNKTVPKVNSNRNGSDQASLMRSPIRAFHVYKSSQRVPMDSWQILVSNQYKSGADGSECTLWVT